MEISEREDLGGDTVEIVGPFRGDTYRLSVDGCRLYGVEMTPMTPGPGADTFFLKVDGRFGIEDVVRDEVKRWGYTHHGPDSEPANKHSVRFTAL